ncbi:pyridoxal phosphate-dependent aminotransferase family protein [Clostridium sp.]|uniref:aminotransferase class I/II-fold pyridoxal phosphate-dependent enzyme n=1 Tax=Clostridium sp. TaxID=1506 RepID=UPI001A6035C0|nr:pyridoxal phosphate-dependent aminotransferase family protein [Clostridium sp.]MBK5235819.1 pyridoxal phosphate-dependent aminotransferase family protein [Clostridium sp.]
MSFDKFYERYKLDKNIVEKIGFNPYYRELKSALSDPISIEGENFINLASNNYLGLADDERVKEAACRAIKSYGTSLCGTPIATGYIDLFKAVEDKLSVFIGLESSILLPSCYQANNGLFSAIAGKEDLIIVDHYAHSSLIEGIKAVGCRIRPFRHNNMEHLEQILKQNSKYRQSFIVTESVFSTDGTIAPFKEIVALASKYNALPIIDDSHGLGVIGKSGKGILEEASIDNYRGIYTASLGKAFANSGGIIAGPKSIIEYLRYYCPHLVYSTALPPSSLGGIEKVIDIIEKDFDNISKRMWNYRNNISNCLTLNGFKLAEGKAPITSIVTRSSGATIYLAKKFYENKILTTPFIAPSVPLNQGRVRLIAGANLKEESIEKVLKIIKNIGMEL